MRSSLCKKIGRTLRVCFRSRAAVRRSTGLCRFSARRRRSAATGRRCGRAGWWRRVQPVEAGGGGDRVLVARPGDDGLAAPGAGADVQAGGLAGEDLGDARRPASWSCSGGLRARCGCGSGLLRPWPGRGRGRQRRWRPLRRPDVGGTQVVAGAVLAGDGEGAQQALPGGAAGGRQPPLPVEASSRVASAASPPSGPASASNRAAQPVSARAARRTSRSRVGGAQVLQVAQAGVGHDDQAGRQRSSQRLDRRGERGQL